jgi:sorbitol/mannitol transport system permease protein
MTAMTARRRSRRLRQWSGQAGWTVLAWAVAIVFFIPVLWMVLTAFKPESDA